MVTDIDLDAVLVGSTTGTDQPKADEALFTRQQKLLERHNYLLRDGQIMDPNPNEMFRIQ